MTQRILVALAAFAATVVMAGCRANLGNFFDIY